MATETPMSHRLDALQMARFVVDGFVEFGNLVPDALNAQVHRDALAYPKNLGYNPNKPREFWDFSDAVREVFELPAVQGVVESLVGPDAVHDHSFLHTVAPGRREAQRWHVDSSLAVDHPRQFDILVCYFPHDSPPEMGPTLVLPGSHVRRVSYHDVTRYKNFLGQRQLSGPGGRIAFIHESLWHCAQPNKTDDWRFMFKIRYLPRVEQRGLFNPDGMDEAEIEAFYNDSNRKYAWAGDQFVAMGQAWRSWWRYLAGAA
ncbi:MAG: phytanoyl-CoA dioxygenase family protein [Chloroflexota bacterium]|nr:phytanoyl-CoA dioxygenase family protein [Chloroflexota bacterium]